MTRLAAEAIDRALEDVVRLEAVHELGLIGTPPEEVFDHFTRIAAASLRVPLASISLVTDARLYVKSHVGLPDDVAGIAGREVRETFCRFVVASGAPVVIDDTTTDPRTCDDAALLATGVAAYLGVPVRSRDGHVVASLAVGDWVPRAWSERDVEILQELAGLAEVELRRRARDQVIEAVRFRDVPAPMWIYDTADHRILAVNDAAVAHYGWTRAEFLTLRLEDMRPPSELAALRSELLRHRDPYVGGSLMRHRLKNGAVRFVQISTQAVEFDGRACRAVLALDVTDTVEGELYFRSLIENANDMVTILNDELVAIYESPSVERVLGYRPDDLIGSSPLELVHPDDRAILQRLLLDRIHEPLATGAAVYRFRHRDGGWRWIESTGRNLTHDPAVRGVVINSRDVTEVRRMETRLRHITASSPAVLFAMTIENDFMSDVWMSDNVRDLLGFEPEDARKLSWWMDNLHPDDSAAVVSKISGLYENDVYAHEHRVRRKDGSWTWVRAQVRALRDENGAIVEMVGSLIDATEFRELEEQLRHALKMEAVGRLAGGVAHDFNNILTAITGHSELLLQDLAPHDPMRPDVEEVRQAANRAAALTRQLLAFSRKQVLRPEPLDLGIVVMDMDRMMRRVVDENIDLITNVPSGLGFVEADRSQIEQVLVNLVVNARDAMPRGGRLSIDLHLQEGAGATVRDHVRVPAGDYLVLSVSDSGCGIPDDVLPRIFEPFFTTKPAGQGTGLGLSTVYGIVKQSGGFVWVRSEPGRGTTFDIQLPRIVHADVAEATRAPTSTAPHGTETILLVEDDDSVRGLADRILRRLGYTVVAAENGGEALLIARRRNLTSIDLLLTDVIMPQMSGSDLADELRRVHPELKVLFMSGYSEEAVVANGVLQAGAALLEKPFTSPSLGMAVRAALDAPSRPNR